MGFELIDYRHASAWVVIVYVQLQAEVSDSFTGLTMADAVIMLIVDVNRLLNCIRYRCFIKKLICGLSHV